MISKCIHFIVWCSRFWWSEKSLLGRFLYMERCQRSSSWRCGKELWDSPVIGVGGSTLRKFNFWIFQRHFQFFNKLGGWIKYSSNSRSITEWNSMILSTFWRGITVDASHRPLWQLPRVLARWSWLPTWLKPVWLEVGDGNKKFSKLSFYHLGLFALEFQSLLR